MKAISKRRVLKPTTAWVELSLDPQLVPRFQKVINKRWQTSTDCQTVVQSERMILFQRLKATHVRFSMGVLGCGLETSWITKFQKDLYGVV